MNWLIPEAEKRPVSTYMYYLSNCLILCAAWQAAKFQMNVNGGIFLSIPAMPNVYGVYMPTLEVLLMKCSHCASSKGAQYKYVVYGQQCLGKTFA